MVTDHITVTGAREHNLADISLTIPRRAITVFAGVSGSGKTSLVFDTIAAEAQRELNDTFTAFVRNRLPSYGRPEVDDIDGLSPVVVIDQRRLGGNSRSTVGTITDIYASLRLLFSRVGEPQIGESTAFSFNDPSGMCPRCSGLGRVVTPDEATFLDPDRSMADGGILLPGFGNQAGNKRYWYRQFADTGLFDVDRPLGDWSKAERNALLHHTAAVRAHGDRVPKDYEGLVDHFTRIYINAEGEPGARKQHTLDTFTTSVQCPDCHGDRLNAAARSVRVAGYGITEMTGMEVRDLIGVIEKVTHQPAGPIVHALTERLQALADIGLGYLNLSRETATLSGGESQRIKMVRHLGSSLTEMLYVFDEPSIGLHPADVDRLIALLRQLRDKGNTILVVEHDPDVIAVADHVVEIGPGAGTAGGTVVFDGDVAGLRAAGTLTALALTDRAQPRAQRREGAGSITVEAADRHNLRDVTVDFPTGVLTVVTGVAGSGKSSLVAALREQHPHIVAIDQTGVSTNRRSTPATYTGVADVVRRRFAEANGVKASLFSPNSDGACPECRGLGVIYTDLAFMAGYTAVCSVCHGKRFTEEVLQYRWDGRSIADVFDLTIDEAVEVFDDPQIEPPLAYVVDVGIGYLTLGQPLNTLSGGEAQRLKLAAELHRGRGGGVYVLDEPTTGLHPSDVGRLMHTLDALVDRGGTVIVVEHNLDVIAQADRIVDLGPGAGHDGGRVVFTGAVADLLQDTTSRTAEYLRRTVA